MPEGTAKKPTWVKRTLLVLSIVSPLAGAVTAVSMSIIDVRAKARRASVEAEAGYETLAPAVGEIQAIVTQAGEWSEYVDDAVDSLEQRISDQERRILRLEAYVEVLSSRRNLPKITDDIYSGGSSVMADIEPPAPPAPRRHIPDDIGKAKAYQQQRVMLKCAPSDPLCGALE